MTGRNAKRHGQRKPGDKAAAAETPRITDPEGLCLSTNRAEDWAPVLAMTARQTGRNDPGPLLPRSSPDTVPTLKRSPVSFHPTRF